MCKECDETKGWKFCPHCGEELKKNASHDKMSQEEFDKIFLDILKSYSEMTWLDECGVLESDGPTCRFVLNDAAGEWLFDVDLNPKNQRFWYSAPRLSRLFPSSWRLEYSEINELMKNQLSKRFKMRAPLITPIH